MGLEVLENGLERLNNISERHAVRKACSELWAPIRQSVLDFAQVHLGQPVKVSVDHRGAPNGNSKFQARLVGIEEQNVPETIMFTEVTFYGTSWRVGNDELPTSIDHIVDIQQLTEEDFVQNDRTKVPRS